MLLGLILSILTGLVSLGWKLRARRGPAANTQPPHNRRAGYKRFGAIQCSLALWFFYSVDPGRSGPHIQLVVPIQYSSKFNNSLWTYLFVLFYPTIHSSKLNHTYSLSLSSSSESTRIPLSHSRYYFLTEVFCLIFFRLCLWSIYSCPTNMNYNGHATWLLYHAIECRSGRYDVSLGE